MELNLQNHGFKPVANPGDSIPGCIYLSKRQTMNSNRAICVIQLTALPENMHVYLKYLRNKVAFKVGFFPLLWALRLQVVVIYPGGTSLEERMSEFVAKFNNQWAIIQSVFFIDPEINIFIARRAWGQYFTGIFQEKISKQIEESINNKSETFRYTETGSLLIFNNIWAHLILCYLTIVMFNGNVNFRMDVHIIKRQRDRSYFFKHSHINMSSIIPR